MHLFILAMGRAVTFISQLSPSPVLASPPECQYTALCWIFLSPLAIFADHFTNVCCPPGRTALLALSRVFQPRYASVCHSLFVRGAVGLHPHGTYHHSSSKYYNYVNKGAFVKAQPDSTVLRHCPSWNCSSQPAIFCLAVSLKENEQQCNCIKPCACYSAVNFTGC